MSEEKTPLKRIRKEKGYSVSQLARKAELAERTIYQIERNGRGNTETLRKLAGALDVSLDELLPPVGLTGNVRDAEIILASRNVSVVKGIEAGRDANIGLGKRPVEPQTLTGPYADLGNDPAARLVEEELSKLPEYQLPPEKKSKLIRSVRRHVKNIILDFVESLKD